MSEEGEAHDDTLTPLDLILDKIGMGYYQWSLLGLCGFGWLADNMWMEGVAVALPRVQDHFGISGSRIGWLSSFLFAGMMFGAVGWGNYSDVYGRRAAFNGCLLLSSIFGLLVSVAPTFPLLCFSLLLLGTAIGGSIPTDGTLFVENLPRGKRYLLTFLSIFFALGAVVAALVAVVILPSNSCPDKPAGATERPPCDVATQNLGWKYVFFALAVITGLMFVCRVVFFQLYESPRYLVHAGRPEEAVYVLQQINKVNGNKLDVRLQDVHDKIAGDITPRSADSNISRMDDHYYATEDAILPSGARARSRSRSSAKSGPGKYSVLRIRNAFSAWYDLSAASLVPQWRRTTLLMWCIWMTTSAGYTLFNLFFPKLVEIRLGKQAEGGSLSHALWNVVIYTLGGTPGSILAAWMVETRLGKRKSLGISLAFTGVLCVVFNLAPTDTGVLITSMGISASTTVMYSVLYGMTPQMFVTEVRGTACGNASALNRIASIIAPPLGGVLLDLDVTFPTYCSALAFFTGAACAFALPFESAADLEASEKGSGGERYTLLH